MEQLPIDSELESIPSLAPPPEIVITEKRLSVLGCLACKTNEGDVFIPDAVRSIQQCTGLLKGTIREIMNAFVDHNYAVVQPRTKASPVGTKRPSTNEHTITKAGANLLLSSWQPCDEEATTRNNPFRGATEVQQGFLRCVSCLISQGKEPRIGDIARCNQRPTTHVNTALKRFVEIGALQKTDATIKYRGKGWQDPKQFIPTKTGREFLPVPPDKTNCLAIDVEPLDTYNELAPTQKTLLTSLYMLTKTGETVAQTTLKAATDIIPSTAKSALERLENLGHISRKNTGGSGTNARYVITITEKGRAAIEASRDYQEKVRRIQACISCAITKQALRGDTAVISTANVAKCQKVSEALVTSCAAAMADVRIGTAPVSGSSKQHSISGKPSATSVNRACLAPTSEKEREYFTMLPEDAFRITHTFEDRGDRVNVSWLGALKHHRLLSRDEEYELGNIIQSAQVPPEAKAEAISSLVEHNVRLAIKAIHEAPAARAFLTFDDRLQAALIGVNNAARKFSPAKGYRFSTYAFAAAKNNIMREAATVADIPENLFWLLSPLQYHFHQYRRENGKAPNAVELSLFAGIPVRDVVNTWKACRPHTSKLLLDKPVATTNNKSDGNLHDVIADGSVEDALTLMPETALRLAKDLEKYEQALLAHNFGLLDISQQEIAIQLAIPQSTVSKASRRVRSLMRHPYYGLAAALPEYEWQTDALCYKVGYRDVVQPPPGEVSKQTQEVCGRCPVRQQCYDLATAGQEIVTAGIWGGYKPAKFRR